MDLFIGDLFVCKTEKHRNKNRKLNLKILIQIQISENEKHFMFTTYIALPNSIFIFILYANKCLLLTFNFLRVFNT